MFFSSVFDCLLYRPPSPDDIDEYSEVQRVLREEIVNPLRKNLFVRADRVLKLRTQLGRRIRRRRSKRELSFGFIVEMFELSKQNPGANLHKGTRDPVK